MTVLFCFVRISINHRESDFVVNFNLLFWSWVIGIEYNKYKSREKTQIDISIIYYKNIKKKTSRWDLRTLSWVTRNKYYIHNEHTIFVESEKKSFQSEYGKYLLTRNRKN